MNEVKSSKCGSFDTYEEIVYFLRLAYFISSQFYTSCLYQSTFLVNCPVNMSLDTENTEAHSQQCCMCGYFFFLCLHNVHVIDDSPVSVSILYLCCLQKRKINSY